jgi:hypothetical protein
MPQYSNSVTYSTIAADTRTILQNNVRDKLIAAGWTVVSGGGTIDTILQSASTPNGNFIQVRVVDPGSGSCCRFYIRNAIGTRVSSEYDLLPDVGKTYKIVAAKYHCFLFVPGACAAREFLCFGTLWCPSFLNGVVVNELGFIHSNAHSDGDTATALSWRTVLYAGWGEGANTRTTGLCNNTLCDYNLQGIRGSHMQFVISSPVQTDYRSSAYKWADDTLLICEPLVSWGDDQNTDGKIRGQLFDALLVTEAFAYDTQINVDGHTWLAVTGNNVGTVGGSWVPNAAKGTLFVAIT